MRYGIHALSNNQTDLLVRYCREVQPPVVKLLDASPDVCRRIKAASPRTKIIGRLVWSPQTHDARRAFINRVLDKARECRGLVDFWEGYNENIGDSASEKEIKAFAQDEVAFARALNDEGFGALIGGFSTGTLDDGKLFAFKEALDYIVAAGPDKCALHWHEYAACYVGYNVKTRDGKNQWPDGGQFTGPSTDPSVWGDPTLRGWLTLRYRELRPLLVKNGWGSVTGYITEFGIDNTGKNPAQWNGWAPLGSGWRNYKGTNWERIAGMGTWPEQVGWFMWQVSHDGWIKGVVGFGFADATTNREWTAFDDSQDLDYFERLILVNQALPFGTIGAQPEPPAGGAPAVSIESILAGKLGARFHDVRAALPQNPNGPNGPFSKRALTLVKYIAVHHSAGPKTQRIEDIADFHVHDPSHLWAGIGYHFVVKGGDLYYVGDIDTARANVGGLNHEVVGACVLGSYEAAHKPAPDTFDERDKECIRALVAGLDAYLARKVTVAGHGSLPGQATACPGVITDWLPHVREGAGVPPPPESPVDPFLAALRAATARAILLPMNPDSAVQKAILADGWIMSSNEIEFVHNGAVYAARKADHPTTKGLVRWYFSTAPWTVVRYVTL